MSTGSLQFNNLSLAWVTAEDTNIIIHSTPYTLFDGRTAIAGVSNVGYSYSFRGIFKNRSTINTIIQEVGLGHNLTVSDEGYGKAQILDFDYSYKMNDGTYNYYEYRLTFRAEQED
jgi:hypothetical protein